MAERICSVPTALLSVSTAASSEGPDLALVRLRRFGFSH
jgi:hypothetical protein